VIEKHTADHVRFAFNKLEQGSPEGDFALDTEMNVSTFNAMVDIFNLQLDIVENVLSSESATDFPWPAVEYTGSEDPQIPPITWNNASTRNAFLKVLRTHRLPHMKATSHDESEESVENRSNRIRAIRSLYETYITNLTSNLISTSEITKSSRTSRLPGRSSSSSSSLMSNLWSKLGPWERACTYRERETKFPFAKVGMCFARWIVERLDSHVDEWKKERIGWYDVRLVEEQVKNLVGLVNGKVVDWESGVVQNYARRQAELAATLKVPDVQEEHEERRNGYANANGFEEDESESGSVLEHSLKKSKVGDKSFDSSFFSQTFSTPSKLKWDQLPNENDLSESMPPPSSSFLLSTIDGFSIPSSTPIKSSSGRSPMQSSKKRHPHFATPISVASSKSVSTEPATPIGRVLFSNNSPLASNGSFSSSTPPPLASSTVASRPESEYSRLKRRLSEVIATSKRELEVSKRRIAEGDSRSTKFS
jgi:hypothetical protein